MEAKIEVRAPIVEKEGKPTGGHVLEQGTIGHGQRKIINTLSRTVFKDGSQGIEGIEAVQDGGVTDTVTLRRTPGSEILGTVCAGSNARFSVDGHTLEVVHYGETQEISSD